MPRSTKKGPFVDKSLLKKIKAAGDNPAYMIKTYSRRSIILPDMIGKVIHVHNGCKFIPVKISDNSVGHKLGEFAPTRIFKSHGGDKKIR